MSKLEQTFSRMAEIMLAALSVLMDVTILNLNLYSCNPFWMKWDTFSAV